MNIEEFYQTTKVDEYFNYLAYAQKYPETKNFYQPYCLDNGIDDKHRLFFHYVQYNKKISYHIDHDTKEDLVIKHKGCHVFSYEACEPDTDLFHRQEKAWSSYVKNQHSNIVIYNLGNYFTFNNNIINANNSMGLFNINKNHCCLNDFLLFALSRTANEDYVIFTNSDCHIESMFYEFILSSNYNYIEFFRCEIQNDQQIAQHKHGIDGFAILKKELQYLLENNLLPDNLIIGAPYWDAIFSNVCHKYIDNLYQDTKRLKHTKHSRRWNFYNLSEGGKNNLYHLNNLYDKGIINKRKVELISSSLVVKVFNKNTNYELVSNALKNSTLNFDYNYLFIEIYDHIKLLNDNNLGGTFGTRIHIPNAASINQSIAQVIKDHIKKHSRIAIVDQYDPVFLNTKFLPKHNFE